MSNFGQIRTNAFMKMAERSGATFTDAEVNEFINREYEKLQNIIIETNEDYFMKSATFDVIADQETYHFPQDMHKLMMLEEFMQNQTWFEITNIPIHKKEAFKSNSFFSFVDGTSGSRYYIKGDCFGLVPIKKTAQLNGLRITYIPILPVLSADTDIPEIPPTYHEMLEIGAVNRCRRAIKEPPIDEGDYQAMLESLINTIQPRVKASPKQVRMIRGMY